MKNRRIIYECRMCKQRFSPGNLIIDDPDDAMIFRDAAERTIHHCNTGDPDCDIPARIGYADKIGMRIEEV